MGPPFTNLAPPPGGVPPAGGAPAGGAPPAVPSGACVVM